MIHLKKVLQVFRLLSVKNTSTSQVVICAYNPRICKAETEKITTFSQPELYNKDLSQTTPPKINKQKY